MKRLLPVLAFLAMGASTGDPKGTVLVTFHDPDAFVDVGYSRSDPPRVRDGILQELRRYIERDAASVLPPGTRLEITITEIDMAGSIRPAQQGGEQMRMITDSSPPRIDLRFTLKAADGAVVREGERKLRNSQFMFGAPPSSAPLRHERDLLESWLAREFAPPR